MTAATARRRQYEKKRSAVRQITYQQTMGSVGATTAWRPAYAVSPSKVASLLAALALAALIITFFAGNPFFVHTAQITGNKLLSTDEILAKTGCKDWNVFWISTRQVEANLMAAFPCLGSARVRCGLPGRMVVEVEERMPEVVWEAANGQFLVDAEGKVLMPAQELAGMLVILDGDRQPLDDDYQPDPKAIQTAQTLRALLGNVQVFGYTRDKGVIVNDSRGYQVFFGVEGDMKLKVACYHALAEQVAANGESIDYIDVRFEKSPFYGRN